MSKLNPNSTYAQSLRMHEAKLFQAVFNRPDVRSWADVGRVLGITPNFARKRSRSLGLNRPWSRGPEERDGPELDTESADYPADEAVEA